MWLALLVAVLAAACSPLARSEVAEPATQDSRLRFYFDDFTFGEGETTLLKEAIAQNGHLSTVAGVTSAKFFVPKGFQLVRKWDVYWTSTPFCLAAYQRPLRAQQLVNCLPGTESITDKGQLFTTLKAAYGSSLAASIAPLTYTLPAEYFDLARALEGTAPSQPWVLKEEVHQGKGVHILPPGAPLLRTALRRSQGGQPQFSLAQQLVADQLLVGGRPFYIRVWVLVFGSDPVRAYLFDGGVVVFGTERRRQQQEERGGSKAQGQPPDDLIVNLWKQDRAAADPWSLQQLREHMDAGAAAAGGSGGFEGVWRQMQLAAAATVAAAVPSMRRAGVPGRLPGYHSPSSGFAVFGVDFVVDTKRKPWLIEMNALPSLARKVIVGNGSAGQEGSVSPFDQQKQRFVGSMLQVLLARHAAYRHQQESICSGGGSSSRPEEKQAAAPCDLGPGDHAHALAAAASEASAAAAKGFVALTPLVYQALGCMATEGNHSCAALQGLHMEAGGGPGQQCSASHPHDGKGWLGTAHFWLGRMVHFLPQFSWGPAAPCQSATSGPAFQHSQLDLMFGALAAS